MGINRRISCIAIDDEPRALKLIEHYCFQIPSVHLLKCFNNPVEALSYLKHNSPDVVFVDINMPEFSGIQLVKNLEKKPLIVFTTAHNHYAVESYELDAIDYLLKPFDFERFKLSVDKIQKHLSLKTNTNITSPIDELTITVMIEYKNVVIKLNDILYIESMDNYIKIHTIDTCHIVLRSLKSILEDLPKSQFVQVHKSFIVSLSKIDFFRKNQITIADSIIPIGRVFLNSFKEQMHK